MPQSPEAHGEAEAGDIGLRPARDGTAEVARSVGTPVPAERLSLDDFQPWEVLVEV